MNIRPVLLACAGAAVFASIASAAEPAPSGSYEVRYRLELPYVEGSDEQTVTVCLADIGGSTEFPVLSANNPLAHCPTQNVRRDGDELSYDIVCPGGNAAKAHALYALRKDGFQGRIAMNMGGKNMTMTEVQKGARVGTCAPEAQTTTR